MTADGKLMVKCNGYIFKKHTTLENGTTHLRCFLNNYRKCKARAVIHPTNPMLIRPNSAGHTHPKEDYISFKQIRDFYLRVTPSGNPNMMNTVQKKKFRKPETNVDPQNDDFLTDLLTPMIPNIDIKQENFD